MTDLAQTAPASTSLWPAGGDSASIHPRKAEEADVPTLANLLAAAFFDDPVFSWCFPDPAPRKRILPAAFRVFIDACRAADELYTTEGHVAGAVCVSPGFEPDEAELAALEEVAGEYAPRAGELSELMNAGHPHEPHYYLFFLATRPDLQSRGIGSAILERLLEPCDRGGIPAYLDATSEHNRRLYLRHGFEVTEEVPLPSGPSFWRMWREPR
jgi:GNAT superfamily N-acetyltransferase